MKKFFDWKITVLLAAANLLVPAPAAAQQIRDAGDLNAYAQTSFRGRNRKTEL